EKTLQMIRTGQNPSLIELKTLMKGQFKSGNHEELGDFSKKVLGKKTAFNKKMTYDEYIDKIAFEIVDKGKSDFAISLLKRLDEATLVDLKSLDKEDILMEVRRLGSISDEQLEIEKQLLFKDKERLFLLAKTAGVSFKATSKADTIFKKLLVLAKRYYENTGVTPFGYEIIK
ncbi:MAG: hypothetical protein N2738_08925, partial [Thermodesulfovibrionales bacterium]|nr:hypothetical protein [Thermodesulfovibrionales bacterium]